MRIVCVQAKRIRAFFFNRKARAEKDRSLNVVYLIISLVQMMFNNYCNSNFRREWWCLILLSRSFFVFFFWLLLVGFV